MCLFPKKISRFIGLLEIGLVTVFMSLFLDLFFVFLDLMEIGFGC